MTARPNKVGIPCIKLDGDNGKRAHVAVHRLVYMAFHGPIPPKHWVKFKDGNKNNPSLINLFTKSPKHAN